MENNNIYIGRKKELEKLHKAYNEAKTGKGKLVLVEGSAGVGKSGFVREFLQQINKDSNTLIGVSECNDKENLNAYAPFKKILIELNTTQNQGDKKNKFKNFIKDAGTSWVELIPFIGTYAKVGIETYEAYQKSYKDKVETNIESENDIFRIFENEFRRLATHNTIVLFIDDLQWADASSLNLIFGLGKAIRANTFNILLIGSYRPNEVKAGRNKITETGATVRISHPFEDKLNMLRTYTKPENHIEGNSNWFQEIKIKPFNEQEINNLINTRFPNNQFKPEFFKTTFDITDGHPLFVVEILGYLVSEGIIYQKEDVFFAQEIKLDNLPTSIDGVISEKVDRLNKELLKVLTYASVNGEEFAFQIIEKILNMDDVEKEDLLVEYLEELSQTHGLLIEGESNTTNFDLDLFSFSQTLVHKFVYKNMSNLKRKRLHKKVAIIMKELYGDILENNKELKDRYNLHIQIGQGLIDGLSLQMSSNNTDKEGLENEEVPTTQIFIDAAKIEIQNANDSYSLFAMTESHNFVDKALAFLSKIDDTNTDKLLCKFEALLWRNKTYQWQGHYQKAFETAEELSSISSQLSNKDFSAQANLALGIAKASLGYNKEALVYLEKAIAYYQTTDNHNSLWKAYYETARTNNTLAADNKAIDLLEKALLLSENIEDKNIMGRTLLLLGKSYSSKLEEFSNVMNYLNKALAIFKETNNQYWIGQAYNRIGLEYRSQFKESKALEYLEKALSIAHEQNDMVNTSHRFNNIALTYEGMSDFEKAIEYYTKSLEIDTRLDDIPMIAKSMNNIGGVYSSKGDYEKAMHYLDKSLEIVKSINNPKELSTSYYTLGTAYEAMNKDEKAVAYYLKAIEIDTSINDDASLSIHSYMLGNFYNNKSNHKLATKYFLKALELLTKLGNNQLIAYTNNSLGLIANSEERNNDAIKYYQKSLNYYIQVEDELNQSDLKENLAKSYYDLKEYEKAVEFYKNAITIAEKLEEQTFLSRQYTGMGTTLYWLDKYDEANVYFLKSISINTELYGENSQEVATNYESIGLSYYWGKKYNLAIENHQKSLTIRKEIFGNESSVTDSSVFNLALSYYLADQDKKAKELFSLSLANREKIYGKNSEEYKKVNEYIEKIDTILDNSVVTGSAPPENHTADNGTYQNLSQKIENSFENEIETFYKQGIIEFKKNNYKEALDSYNKALESCVFLENNDVNNKTKAEIYHHIGEANSALGEYDTAIGNFIDAYNTYIEIAITDRKTSDLAKTCSNLGDTYYSKKDYKNALENHKEALEYFSRDKIFVAWSYYDVGKDYYWLKEYESAISYIQKAIEIKTQQLKGLDDEVIASYYFFLGLAFYNSNDYVSAIDHFKSSYTIRKNILGANSKATDRSLFTLGKAYYSANNMAQAKDCLYTSLKFRKDFFGENSNEYKKVKEWIDEYDL